MKEFNVLLADDHDIVRTGSRILVQKEFPGAKIREASDGEHIMREVQKTEFLLIVMDICMPNTDSLTIISNILALHPNTRILVMSMQPEDIYAIRYLQKGCYGYLHKSASNDEFTKAIRNIVSIKKKYISENVLTKLSDNLFSPEVNENPFNALSNREIEVIRNFLNGNSLSEISSIMNVHTSTIATLKSRAFEKLNINNLIQLRNLADLHQLK